MALDPAGGAEARSSPRFDPDGLLSAHTPAPLVVPGGRWHGGDAGVQQDCETALNIAEIARKRVGAICTSERKDPDKGVRVRICLMGFGPNNKFYFCWGCVPT